MTPRSWRPPERAPRSRPGSRTLSRRELMALGLGSAGAGLTAAALRRPAGAQDATPSSDHAFHGSAAPSDAPLPWLAWEPADLAEPEVRSSTAGQLDTELRVAYAYHDIGGYRLNMRSYEGSIPGPTLRVQPGDTLRIRLSNDLPPNRDPAPANQNLPHHFNTTNLHAHGLHVSPSDIADDIFRSMEPGQAYDVEIAIPDDHPSGTYWYHPHRHGSADVQIASGMAGALVVGDDFADVPEIADATERVLILNEVIFDYQGMIEQYDTVWREAVPRFLSVNGQREPIIRLRPGEVQRWRIIHAGHEDNLRLALEGHSLHAIAYDGIQASMVDRYESLEMGPGQRADILVQAGEPGTYLLAAVANDQGYPSPTGPLARVVIAGDPSPMELPTALPRPPLETIHDDELTGSRVLTLSVKEPEYPPAADYQEFAFLIDGRQFDHDRVDQRIALGAVEEWTFVNAHDNDHVVHVHTNPFQVTQINGTPLAVPVWRDTVIVRRNETVTVRSRFLDFPGRTVLHCHMMNHEELGMMQVVEFVTG